MRARLMMELSTLESSELLFYECSDRIILPKSLSESFEIQDLVLIYNYSDEYVSGGVYKTHEEDEETIYMPSWMFWKHDFTGNLRIVHADKKPWTALQVQPHNSSFQKSDKFLAQLYGTISSYSSLNQNSTIPLCVDGKIELVTIRLAFPLENKLCCVAKCSTIDLQIFQALDSITAEKPIPFLFSSPLGDKCPYAFLGKGYSLGGSPIPSNNPGQMAADAARKRLSK